MIDKFEIQCWNCGGALLIPANNDEEFHLYAAKIYRGLHCTICNVDNIPSQKKQYDFVTKHEEDPLMWWGISKNGSRHINRREYVESRRVFTPLFDKIEYSKEAWILEKGNYDCWACKEEGFKEVYYNEQMGRALDGLVNPAEWMCPKCYDKYFIMKKTNNKMEK